MKKIYFYNRKYPEYEIKEIKVKDEQYYVNSRNKVLSGIYAKYDINCYCKSETEHLISLCQPYEDEGIYVHDIGEINRELVFSYNLDTLKEWREEDIDNTIHKLENRLRKLYKDNIEKR